MRTSLGVACALVIGITVVMAVSAASPAGLERLWWMAFAATAAGYVLVLGSMGVRRLRSAPPAPSTWMPLDVPSVAARPNHVRPQL
ncbi:MAG TPA: hypothetical protein VMF13_23590 [Luteitalea sp.]|nr:hypothetical protein [Luteitalea sp.]